MSTKKRTTSKVVDDEELKKKVKTANLKWKEILKEPTQKKKTVVVNEVQHTKTLLQNRHKEKQDSKADIRALNRLFDILYPPPPSKKTNRRTTPK